MGGSPGFFRGFCDIVLCLFQILCSCSISIVLFWVKGLYLYLFIDQLIYVHARSVEHDIIVGAQTVGGVGFDQRVFVVLL